jgi:alpha-glucosidase
MADATTEATTEATAEATTGPTTGPTTGLTTAPAVAAAPADVTLAPRDAGPWHRDAVVYEAYVRSFADGDGDGLGDLAGLRARLPYLRWLGVDAVWLTPFYPSPGVDHGYDVANYRDVDPEHGTLEEFDRLVADAHRLGVRVVVDIVPNHTSSEHPWFRNATSSRDNPDRAKYIFRDPAPGGGPPNNWASVFGGPAWTFHEPTGQYYLHLFAPQQPDLDWRNPEVRADFEKTLKFWLDRGVDGFRIDVAHALLKDAALRDTPERAKETDDATDYQGIEQPYAFDQPEVHDVYRSWRRLVDAYDGDRLLLGEVYLYDLDRLTRYVRPDELHLAFNFLLLREPWDAARIGRVIGGSIRAFDEVGALSTWVLESHDATRLATRFGGAGAGRRRARAALLPLLALPGPAFIYQGQELGLEEVDLPPEKRQDPIFFRTGGRETGRDGCRIPLPWDGEPPGFGFTTGAPWLPIPADWAALSVSAQRDDPGSTLTLTREAIAVRRGSEALRRGGFGWRELPGGLAFERWLGDERVLCAVNCSADPVELRCDGVLLVASDGGARMADGPDGGRMLLPPDTAAWVRLPDRARS